MSSFPKFDVPPGMDDHLCLAIYSANLAIQRTYKPVLDELGITYPQYLTLNLLWHQDERPVGQLAKELDLEASTMTPLLKRMETSGLIERRRNKEDERQVTIALTKKGQRLRKKAGCVAEELQATCGYETPKLRDLNILVRQLRDALKGSILPT